MMENDVNNWICLKAVFPASIGSIPAVKARLDRIVGRENFGSGECLLTGAYDVTWRFDVSEQQAIDDASQHLADMGFDVVTTLIAAEPSSSADQMAAQEPAQ